MKWAKIKKFVLGCFFPGYFRLYPPPYDLAKLANFIRKFDRWRDFLAGGDSATSVSAGG